MAHYWYKRTHDSPSEGPCSASHLRRLAADGVLSRHSLISTDELRWVPASRVKKLFAKPHHHRPADGAGSESATRPPSPSSPASADTWPVAEPQGPSLLDMEPTARRVPTTPGYPITHLEDDSGEAEDVVSISAPDEAGPDDTLLTGDELMPLPTPVRPYGPRVFSIALATSQSWRVMVNNWAPIFGATAVAALIQLGLGLVPVIGWLASLVVSPVLLAGLLFMGVSAYRGHRLGVGEMLLGFRRFGALIGIAYLRLLIVIACCAPTAIAGAIAMVLEKHLGPRTTMSIILSTPISGILVLAVSMRLVFAELVCLDTGSGVVSSMRQSWLLTGPIALPLLAFILLLGLISLATSALCLLPYLFLGLPLVVTGLATAYNLALPPVRANNNART